MLLSISETSLEVSVFPKRHCRLFLKTKVLSGLGLTVLSKMQLSSQSILATLSVSKNRSSLKNTALRNLVILELNLNIMGKTEVLHLKQIKPKNY